MPKKFLSDIHARIKKGEPYKFDESDNIINK